MAQVSDSCIILAGPDGNGYWRAILFYRKIDDSSIEDIRFYDEVVVYDRFSSIGVWTSSARDGFMRIRFDCITVAMVTHIVARGEKTRIL